ncbi:MAG: hypothetical protein SGILL_006193 [Bacillariaceae sp.]
MPIALNSATAFLAPRLLRPRASFSRCSPSAIQRVISSSTASGVKSEETFTTSQQVATAFASERLFPEELNVLYDSKCNVCKLEMEWLANRDARINSEQLKLKLTDLESSNFDPKDPANGGINYETGMAAIYAVTADGKVLKGVPAFVAAYEEVQLGWLWSIYSVPGIQHVFNWGYDIFAKYRTRLTRGSALDELVEMHKLRQEQLAQEVCESCKKIPQ